MNHKFVKYLILLLFVFLGTACSSSKIATRFYAEDKPRVDQEIYGNAGYIMGGPEEPIPPPEKKTRKIYILEFSQDVDQPVPDGTLYERDSKNDKGPGDLDLPPRKKVKVEPAPAVPKIALPEFDEMDETSSADTGTSTRDILTEYTVEENDTLQKISKKFYDSYSKWHKIYEVNKSLIKDPNFIKPGIVIKIPRLQ